MKKKYIIILIIIGSLLFITISLGIINAIWLSKDNNNNNNISINNSGCINIIYSDDKDIAMKNVKPQSDDDGMTTIPYTITITNNCKYNESVELDLDVLEKSSIDDNKIKIFINGDYELGPTILGGLRYNKGEDDVAKIYQLASLDINQNDTKRINLRLWLDENVPPQEEDLKFIAEYYIQIGKNNIVETLKEKLINKFKVLENTDYGSISNNEEGFIKIDNNYYLRGNNELNYVKFANHTWRIMGITSNDDIKLIYADGDLMGKYNEKNNEEQLGYEDSVIDRYLKSWYEDNLKAYDDLIVSYKYCNDSSNKVENRIEYGSYRRVFNDTNPSLKCPSTDKEYGGVYESKIGLITLDEANIIGGTSKENNKSYYLYDGKEYFTMSPAYTTSQAWIATINKNGKLDVSTINSNNEIRPVINISNFVKVSGSGSFEDPYVISE